MNEPFPSNAIVIRFGMLTPFWLFSMSYGMFNCPSERRTFHSPDQAIAYHMLARPEDRARIMKTPNGYLAHNNLQAILNDSSCPESDVIVRNWADNRDVIMLGILRLKYSQSAMLAEALMRTRDRPILDDSRSDDEHWCVAQGRGKDMHGKLTEQVRAELISGELLPMVARSH